MSGRHEAREWAVQFLFQRDFNADEMDPAMELFWSGRKPTRKTRTFAEQLIRGVLEHQAELDARIQTCADNWSLKRMGGVERNALRVATYEMLHCPDIPPIVSINEAVQVTKDFSNEDGGKFVNGILDRLLRTLDRAAAKET